MSVLVDSSAWIEYLRGTDRALALDALIDEDLIVINDLILAELVPPLALRQQQQLIALLRRIPRPPLRVDWDDLIDMQITCLRNGISGVGVPDLIIAQNAMQHELELFTYDRHFGLLAQHTALSLYRGGVG